MIPTVDAIAVLGSRHGLLLDPIRRNAALLRFDTFKDLVTWQMRAGVRIGGREVLFPFCEESREMGFALLDQRMTPCTSSLIGIDPTSGVKVTLSVITPFRPRDAEFSTTPVLTIRLIAERLPGQYRWTTQTENVSQVELFFSVNGDRIETEISGSDWVDVKFTSQVNKPSEGTESNAEPERKASPQRDRLIALHGRMLEGVFSRTVSLDEAPQPLTVAWCAHSASVFSMHSEALPFRYTSRFGNLEEVANWARSNPDAIVENARRVDGIVGQNNCANSVNHLLAYSLHTWLANTWWLRHGDEEFFYVSAGNTYYLSSVDVEFTQAPFYLSVWPELLRLQLEQWSQHTGDGTKILGEIGEGTRYLEHDTGMFSSAGNSRFHHQMEVEETANYLILCFAYWRRTADRSVLDKQTKLVVEFLWFLIRADSTGNGIPDQGVANTLADGPAAIQYGGQQVYLAIKTLAALKVGEEMLKVLNHEKLAAKCAAQADLLLHTIVEKGWQKDHFGVLLEKSGCLKDPWTGQERVYGESEEILGWNAAHILSANALGVLDMTGFDIGLPRKMIERDLEIAAEQCRREYGCVHMDFEHPMASTSKKGARRGVAASPGSISLNIARDIAAYYREIDLRHFTDGYWEWQLVANAQEQSLFFDSFDGNNLKFYPRGLVAWGLLDALGGVVVDQVRNFAEAQAAFPGVRVPFLLYADWIEGNVTVVEGITSPIRGGAGK